MADAETQRWLDNLRPLAMLLGALLGAAYWIERWTGIPAWLAFILLVTILAALVTMYRSRRRRKSLEKLEQELAASADDVLRKFAEVMRSIDNEFLPVSEVFDGEEIGDRELVGLTSVLWSTFAANEIDNFPWPSKLTAGAATAAALDLVAAVRGAVRQLRQHVGSDLDQELFERMNRTIASGDAAAITRFTLLSYVLT